MLLLSLSEANFAAFVSVGCECIISALSVSEKNGSLGLFLAGRLFAHRQYINRAGTYKGIKTGYFGIFQGLEIPVLQNLGK